VCLYIAMPAPCGVGNTAGKLNRMAWDFETDPEFQSKLDWMDHFVREEVEPLDLVFRGPADPFDPAGVARPRRWRR
jgi:hypothetical protein